MMKIQRYSPIGLDIRQGSVCAAQLVRSSRGLRAHRLAHIPEDDRHASDDRVGRIVELLQRRGFVGREVVIAAPREAVRSSVVSVPKGADTAAMNAIARSEIARMHELDPSSFELACWTLPGAAGARQDTGGALASICPHESVTPLLERFESMGYDISAIDLESQALVRACRPLMHGGDGDLRVIVDLGWSHALLIVTLGSTVLYERSIPECALEQLVRDASGVLELQRIEAEHAVLTRGLGGFDAGASAKASRIRSLIEDYSGVIAGEISMSVEYAARKHGVSDAQVAMLIGPGAAIPGIDQRLAESCELRVDVVRPRMVLEDPGGDTGCDDPALLVALGLAARIDRG